MKIQGRGLPFSHHQSSCSNRIPKNFTWTKEESEIQLWMDLAIPYGAQEVRKEGIKKYGWFCESKAILPHLQDAFDNPSILEEIVDAYDGIFTCDRELVNKHEKIHFCLAGSNLPWIPEKDYKIYDKSEFGSFIASSKIYTEGHKFRHKLYNNLKVRSEGHNIVHLFGGISNNMFGVKKGCHLLGYKGNDWNDKSEALNDFMFSIVIENDQYDDYFTEKITDCFATGTIPVYYGTKNIGNYFNTDGIIEIPNDETLVDFIITNRLNKDLYYSKMDAIEDNLERVKNMQLADDMLFDKIQELNS
jgi:hypothetical protein